MKTNFYSFLLPIALIAAMSNLGSFAQPVIQWQTTLGGSTQDDAFSIQQTEDSGYIVSGASYSIDSNVTGNHGGSDYWIVKLDDSGNLQWEKSFGGSDDDDGDFSIQQTTDGGYVVAGESISNDGDVSGNHGIWDYWVVKMDSSGNLQWQKCLGGSEIDEASYIQQTLDGGYIIAGLSNSVDGDVTGNHGNFDYWVVRLDSSGTIRWQKSLGGSGDDQANSVQQTTDGGYIVAGWSSSTDGDVTGHHSGIDTADYWVVKLDSGGAIQWQKSLGGNLSDRAYSIQQTEDDGYIVAGASYSNNGDVSGNHGASGYDDYWVAKLDDSGNLEWQKCLGGSSLDEAMFVQQTDDKGYVITGYTLSSDGDITSNHGLGFDAWTVKLDSSGNLQWQKCLGGSLDDYARCIRQTYDGGYIIAGESLSSDGDVSVNFGSFDYWIVKLSMPVNSEYLLKNKIALRIYPNPSRNEFTIYDSHSTIENIEVFNLLGEKIYSNGIVNSELYTVQHNFPSGIYFVKVKDEERESVEKIIVE